MATEKQSNAIGIHTGIKYNTGPDTENTTIDEKRKIAPSTYSAEDANEVIGKTFFGPDWAITWLRYDSVDTKARNLEGTSGEILEYTKDHDAAAGGITAGCVATGIIGGVKGFYDTKRKLELQNPLHYIKLLFDSDAAAVIKSDDSKIPELIKNYNNKLKALIQKPPFKDSYEEIQFGINNNQICLVFKLKEPVVISSADSSQKEDIPQNKDSTFSKYWRRSGYLKTMISSPGLWAWLACMTLAIFMGSMGSVLNISTLAFGFILALVLLPALIYGGLKLRDHLKNKKITAEEKNTLEKQQKQHQDIIAILRLLIIQNRYEKTNAQIQNFSLEASSDLNEKKSEIPKSNSTKNLKTTEVKNQPSKILENLKKNHWRKAALAGLITAAITYSLETYFMSLLKISIIKFKYGDGELPESAGNEIPSQAYDAIAGIMIALSVIAGLYAAYKSTQELKKLEEKINSFLSPKTNSLEDSASESTIKKPLLDNQRSTEDSKIDDNATNETSSMLQKMDQKHKTLQKHIKKEKDLIAKIQQKTPEIKTSDSKQTNAKKWEDFVANLHLTDYYKQSAFEDIERDQKSNNKTQLIKFFGIFLLGTAFVQSGIMLGRIGMVDETGTVFGGPGSSGSFTDKIDHLSDVEVQVIIWLPLVVMGIIWAAVRFMDNHMKEKQAEAELFMNQLPQRDIVLDEQVKHHEMRVEKLEELDAHLKSLEEKEKPKAG